MYHYNRQAPAGSLMNKQAVDDLVSVLRTVLDKVTGLEERLKEVQDSLDDLCDEILQDEEFEEDEPECEDCVRMSEGEFCRQHKQVAVDDHVEQLGDQMDDLDLSDLVKK